MLRFMGSQIDGHDWGTELNWTEHSKYFENMMQLELVIVDPQEKKKNYTAEMVQLMRVDNVHKKICSLKKKKSS